MKQFCGWCFLGAVIGGWSLAAVIWAALYVLVIAVERAL